MSIEQQIEQVSAKLNTLATSDVVSNTFGMVSSIQQGLQSIERQLPNNGGRTLSAETTDRLRELTMYIEDNQLLFGIPERWLIDSVVKSAQQIRLRLDK